MDKQETIRNMSVAAYEFHRGMAQLARGANDKPAEEIQSGLDEALVALDEMRKTVVALKAEVGGDAPTVIPAAAAEG